MIINKVYMKIKKIPERIQGMDESSSMWVILCEEAECESCYWVMAPGPVQIHKQLAAFLKQK